MTITPEQFREARRAAGLTLEACAKALHCSARCVSYYETSGRGRPVDPARFELLLWKYLQQPAHSHLWALLEKAPT